MSSRISSASSSRRAPKREAPLASPPSPPTVLLVSRPTSRMRARGLHADAHAVGHRVGHHEHARFQSATPAARGRHADDGGFQNASAGGEAGGGAVRRDAARLARRDLPRAAQRLDDRRGRRESLQARGGRGRPLVRDAPLARNAPGSTRHPQTSGSSDVRWVGCRPRPESRTPARAATSRTAPSRERRGPRASRGAPRRRRRPRRCRRRDRRRARPPSTRRPRGRFQSATGARRRDRPRTSEGVEEGGHRLPMTRCWPHLIRPLDACCTPHAAEARLAVKSRPPTVGTVAFGRKPRPVVTLVSRLTRAKNTSRRPLAEPTLKVPHPDDHFDQTRWPKKPPLTVRPLTPAA